MKRKETALDKWARFRYMPCIPLNADGTRVTACEKHRQLSRKAACEGMVLLKNEGRTLPLKKGNRLVIFGKGQYDYIKGGGGSGDVETAYVRNIYDGLKQKEAEGRVEVYDGLIGFYEQEMEQQYAEGRAPGKETEEPEIPEKLLKEAKAFTDTAVITISRFSGEDSDRRGGLSAGDYYLSENEEKMIRTVCANFEHIIAVINAGAQTDTEWYADNERISAVLYAWQGGMEGGLAIADILCGEVNPSGKLADTFAKRLTDYPSTESFQASRDFVKYEEDIYVGYRYFETIETAKDQVRYPFGYGLSYTEFEISHISAREQDGKIRIRADVTNTGKVKGREVMQVYYQAPQGKLGKSRYELAAFEKTKELEPGETRTVFLSFDLTDMASYDDTGKVAASAWVLEKGRYSFFVGNSIRNLNKTAYEYVVESDRVVQQLTGLCGPKNLEKRMLADGSFEKLDPRENNRYENDYLLNTTKPPREKAMLEDVARGRVTLDEFMAQLTLEQLISLTYGKPEAGISNTAGMGDLKEYGIPNVMTADGPAGLRISPGRGVYTTAFPCGTLLACSWDPELLYKVGEACALEIKENNLAVWFAPGLNIHKNPLCGRNFEYFSEDPLLTGKLAAAEIAGIQSQHIAACAKHFCANNKEENRGYCDSILSERALREIYLKGFEICVKEAGPWVIMTAYNKVNGVYSCENWDIITGILRKEWGFTGLVVTDWATPTDHTKELKAGNDIKMPYGFRETVKTDLENGEISRAEIEVSVRRLLELLLKLD